MTSIYMQIPIAHGAVNKFKTISNSQINFFSGIKLACIIACTKRNAPKITAKALKICIKPIIKSKRSASTITRSNSVAFKFNVVKFFVIKLLMDSLWKCWKHLTTDIIEADIDETKSKWRMTSVKKKRR